MTGEIAAAPMTRHRPIFNRGRALTDRYDIGDLPAAIVFPGCVYGSADRALRSKVLNKLLLKHTAGLNELRTPEQ